MTTYLITVTTSGRRRTNLHTFSKIDEAPHLRWMLEVSASHRQLKQRQVPGFTLPKQWPPPPLRPNHLEGATYSDEIPEGAFDLAEGVDVSGATFTVVLDALRRAGRHFVDIDDIKVVVSELGWRIKMLPTLDEDTRRLALDALYPEIVKRCSTLSPADKSASRRGE